MATSPTESNTPSNDAQYTPEGRKQSPPAFLDLADSAARLGTNMPDMSALKRMEKRMEHERQRAIQRQLFEEQMKALEQQQAAELLSIPVDPNDVTSSSGIHMALSAPTTPPRAPSVVNGLGASPTSTGLRDSYGLPEHQMHASALTSAMSKADKRKSVTYAPSPSILHSPEAGLTVSSAASLGPIARAAGAKSMPASRRTSASAESLEADDLAGTLQSLALMDPNGHHSQPQSILKSKIKRFADEPGVIGDSHGFVGHGGTAYNAGMMLDQQLDQEMHNAMRNLPTSDDDKYHKRGLHDAIGKSSEWPQFSGPPRGGPPDIVIAGQRPDQRRTVTNPGHLSALGPAFNEVSGSKLGATVSASATPNIAQHHTPNDSRRSSPPGMSDTLSTMSAITTARSVPATPLGVLPGRTDMTNLAKVPGTPGAGSGSGNVGFVPHPVNQLGGGGLGEGQGGVSATDLSATLSRLGNGQYENPLSFGSIQHNMDDSLQVSNYYSCDGVYGASNNLSNGLPEGNRYNSYGFDQHGRMNSTQAAGAGSTALYHHHGSRYGLGLGSRMVGPDSKMNGLHGPKHKRGDIDREFNRFAGTRLEELQGEIPQLCKDQHGCRYLQKKLEEGVPEHRDMIFRETFGHFADLMTDPFGNYLCQKLLEYSTDEQRNVICESVASDLVTISLNMHGTRAVQKMIDFLSTQRQASNQSINPQHCAYKPGTAMRITEIKQADLRYDAQIHAIIVALSLHVVTLIKDLNGNHVIQKCLNKLAPDDNQFIYNAVAANCVEVATHRHGCCVLQRCIDHASDQQRVQLVQEITYNALTLVQDPYGNYVVQYILDLNDNRFSDGVIRQFTGNVCALSVQKFSSNVIEKCIRVAEHNTRKMLIDELLNRARLEKLLRDSYGNYCVQTALDYAEPNQRMALVEGIRPILPLIRNTPYGKRIQSKLQREQMDAASSGHYGGGGYPNNQHQALANLSIGLGGHPHGGHAPQGRHIHAQSIHHPNQLNQIGDMYNQSSLYSLQNGAGLHPHQQPGLGQTQLHNQQLHSSLQHHSPIEGYVLQNNSSHGALGGNHASSGFGSTSAFSTPLGGGTFGSSVSLGAGLTDHYHQQRASFPYGM
ncbi:ARM repeat-containing protein [Hysterangium stoloniferum]|nr:ARM repeat-containing protein [Hysterangium stoloniferum]